MQEVMAYYLKHNKQTTIPQQLLFYDTESEITKKNGIEEHVFKLVGFRHYKLYGRDYKLVREGCYTNISMFWDYIDKIVKKKSVLWVISHNQHYDFFIIDAISSLKSRGYELKEFSFSTQMFFARFRKTDGKTLLFVDNMNYFKTSIEELGKILSKQKLKIDFTTASHEMIYYRIERAGSVEFIRAGVDTFNSIVDHPKNFDRIKKTFNSIVDHR